MNLVTLLVGVALVTLGRELFWLFVGGVGFAVGVTLASQFVVGQPEWIGLGIALVSGMLGAILALSMQRLAVLVAGFVGGGEATLRFLHVFHVHSPAAPWLAFLIGGLVGAVLLRLLFNWTLIGLSSVVGASLIVQAVHVHASYTAFLYAALVALGVLVQTGTLRRKRSRLRL